MLNIFIFLEFFGDQAYYKLKLMEDIRYNHYFRLLKKYVHEDDENY